MRTRDTAAARTLTEEIFERVLADILACRLKPGDKLKVEHLRAVHGVGSSPVREALSRLTAAGLVHAEGQRGFFVSEVSPDDLLDLTRLRIMIEGAALRSSIRNGDRDWEARLLAAAHRLGVDEGTPKQGTTIDPEWEVLHREFHQALVAACDSPRLLAYRETLNDMSDRYRHLAVATGAPGRDPAAEHRMIMTAALERRTELASTLLENHFLETARRVLIGMSIPEGDVSGLLETVRKKAGI